MSNPIKEELETLAELEPGKFQVDKLKSEFASFYIRKPGNAVKRMVQLDGKDATQDSLDSILREVGICIFVVPQLRLRLNVIIVGDRWEEELPTEINGRAPDAQLQAKLLGFKKAVQLFKEEKK